MRAAIPAWPALLIVYGFFLVPTIFACLVAINIAVWANSRINYVFIFGMFGPTVLKLSELNRRYILELDIRNRIDHHEAMEVRHYYTITTHRRRLI